MKVEKNMYNWRKGLVQWTIKDTLYISVVFSWDIPEAVRIAEASRRKVVMGGPAILNNIDQLPLGVYVPTNNGMSHSEFPALSFHNPLATFTTRGCPNGCPFCSVPIIEGDLKELKEWEPRPLVCDSNLLAASTRHFDRVIDSLKALPFVDFNQGLDATLFTSYHAERIAELKAVKVRFSLDSMADRGDVYDAVFRVRAQGISDIGVYVLIGYDDTPATAREKLDWVRSLKIRPTPMRYQPLKCVTKNSYVAPGWTEKELQDMVRYYSRLRWLEHIPYEDYRHGSEEKTMPLFMEAKA